MIIIKIKGGLGNQMFQYAMARRVQLEYKIDSIGFDLERVEHDNIRDYGLNHFKLDRSVDIIKNKGLYYRVQEDISRRLISYWVAGRSEGIAQKREEILGNFLALFGIVQRDHSIFKEKKILKFHRNIYMNGWFQTASLLQPIRKILLEDFQWKETERLKKSTEYSKITASNSVCIHVRRGDYVNNPIFDVCHNEYYYKAIEYMKNVIEDPVFFIFSDDIAWVKKNMNFDANVHIMELQNKDYEDLFFMKNCKHFIMSNSTYSWWAQFLGTDMDKIVIAPDRWCLMDDMSVSIYMPEWILISTT